MAKEEQIEMEGTIVDTLPNTMFRVELDVDGDRIETLLQNAETIKVATSEGRKAVTDLEAGDDMLVYYEDVARHFGEAVEESIIEK